MVPQHHPTRLADACADVFVGAPHSLDAALIARHAEGGCSPCARAFVNTQGVVADLALSVRGRAPRAALRDRAPRAALRDRVLSRAEHALAAPRSSVPPASTPGFRDPSASVAHHHIGGPDEPERRAEVEALDLLAPNADPGDAPSRMLEQLASFIGFPILFVSAILGERVGYHVQRGLPEALRGFRELRREMSYCTHCVDAGAPLVVQDARAEPFFRGSKMVQRFGIVAYVGVPLRTARGVTVGTLCAMDVAPRRPEQGVVPFVELFAARAVAELERKRTPDLLARVIEVTTPAQELHTTDWFVRLLRICFASSRASGRTAAPSVLIGARAPAEALLALARPYEVCGRLPSGAVGLLLSEPSPLEVARRHAELRAALGERAGRAVPADAAPNADAWTEAPFP